MTPSSSSTSPPTVVRKPRPITYHIRLSDRAWAGLLVKARKAGYVRRSTAKGLGKFMCDIIDMNPTGDLWQDTRPQDVKQWDIPALESGHYVMWDTDEPREVHSVDIPLTHQRKTADLARALNIARDNQGIRAVTTTSRVSEFWEAYGLSWITNTNPTIAHYRTPSRLLKPPNKLNSELDW